jgi:hypothetical protein
MATFIYLFHDCQTFSHLSALLSRSLLPTIPLLDLALGHVIMTSKSSTTATFSYHDVPEWVVIQRCKQPHHGFFRVAPRIVWGFSSMPSTAKQATTFAFLTPRLTRFMSRHGQHYECKTYSTGVWVPLRCRTGGWLTARK